jgi:hypothetical protein
MDQPAAPAVAAKPPLKERMKVLVEEYGTVAVVTYLAISLCTVAAFAIAIHIGIKVEGSTEPGSGLGLAATLGAAWVAAKVTVPLRILGTLVLTPVLGKLVHRFRKQPPTVPPPAITG